MNHDSTLLTAVAMGDSAAAQTLTERYAGPLFRFCRLNFTDHYRAGDFIDEFLAGWILKLRKGSIQPGTILDLFREAFRQSAGRWVGERGRGLSAKQRRILEIMEQVPLDSRIALDLFYLEDKSGEEIARSLGIEPESIGSIASEFFNMLASDDTIKEFLKHALIHQSREKQTAGRKDRPEPLQREQATTIFASGERQARAGTAGRPGFGTRRPEGFSPRDTRRETGSAIRRETRSETGSAIRRETGFEIRRETRPETGRDDRKAYGRESRFEDRNENRYEARRQSSREDRPEAGRETRSETENTRPDSVRGRKPTYEERQKSRAGRRRVDPRQLDFDI